MVQKMFGISEARRGTKVELLHAGTDGHQKFGKITIQTLEEGRVPAKEAKNWRIDKEKNCTILKWKVQWHEKASGTWQRKKE